MLSHVCTNYLIHTSMERTVYTIQNQKENYSTLLRLMNTHSVLLIKTKVLLFMHIEMTHRIIAIFLVRKIQHQRGFKINFYQNFHLFP